MKVFIWTPPDIFTQHKLDQKRSLYWDMTVCGIWWDDLPDNILMGKNGIRVETNEGDKPWYYDHDRDDVVLCQKCYP